MIDSNLGIRFHVAAVIIGLALTPIRLLAQAAPDYLPFDPARIGLPALTEAGRDYLIEQHKQLVQEARRNIQEIRQADLSGARERIARYDGLIVEEFRQIAHLAAGRVQDAMKTAAAAQVSDLANLRSVLTTVIEASRFSAVNGYDEEALQQYQSAVKVLTTFSSNFLTTCYSQSFDPRIALGLERQNELLGTGIDVTPCAHRKYTAEGKGADILWRFSHCGIGIGDWKIETAGPLQGKGVGTIESDLSGTWLVDESSSVIRIQYSGDLKLIPKLQEGSDGPGDLWVDAKQSTVTTAGGKGHRMALNISVLIFPVKKSDMPCRQTDQ